LAFITGIKRGLGLLIKLPGSLDGLKNNQPYPLSIDQIGKFFSISYFSNDLIEVDHGSDEQGKT
jgi:hypothetical protein